MSNDWTARDVEDFTTNRESTPAGPTTEDLLYPSQSAHFHCQPQAIRWPGDVDDDTRALVQQRFDAGDLEAVPVHVVTRNRQPDAVRVRSTWDGTDLHLDVCPTRAREMALRPALHAVRRYYASHRLKLAALVVLGIVVVAIVAYVTMGVF